MELKDSDKLSIVLNAVGGVPEFRTPSVPVLMRFASLRKDSRLEESFEGARVGRYNDGRDCMPFRGPRSGFGGAAPVNATGRWRICRMSGPQRKGLM